MKAADTEIDAMRQWVIVQAQANDDLGAYNPDYVIAAVLMTGSNLDRRCRETECYRQRPAS